jgi:hypothetical protein
MQLTHEKWAMCHAEWKMIKLQTKYLYLDLIYPIITIFDSVNQIVFIKHTLT